MVISPNSELSMRDAAPLQVQDEGEIVPICALTLIQ